MYDHPSIHNRRGPARLSDADYRELQFNLGEHDMPMKQLRRLEIDLMDALFSVSALISAMDTSPMDTAWPDAIEAA